LFAVVGAFSSSEDIFKGDDHVRARVRAAIDGERTTVWILENAPFDWWKDTTTKAEPIGAVTSANNTEDILILTLDYV
jgi:hypothetical protein